MKGLPTAEIVHCLNGRVRFSIPSRKRDVPFFEKLVQALSKEEGIMRIEANPLTGSLLVLYEGDLKKIVNVLEGTRLVKVSQGMGKTATLKSVLISSFKKLDLSVRSLSLNQVDLSTLLALFFILLGLNELRKGRMPSPPWYFTLMSALTLIKQSK